MFVKREIGTRLEVCTKRTEEYAEQTQGKETVKHEVNHTIVLRRFAER